MSSPGYAYRARQHPAEMLQSVACLVGTGKTVAVRAAVASLDPARHTVIYIGNPSTGVRGILAITSSPPSAAGPSTAPPPSPSRPGTSWPARPPNEGAPPS